MTIAGLNQNLRRLASTVTDEVTRKVLTEIENKVLELNTRLTDIEKRVKAGGL
jgi:hypothetical protein